MKKITFLLSFVLISLSIVNAEVPTSGLISSYPVNSNLSCSVGNGINSFVYNDFISYGKYSAPVIIHHSADPCVTPSQAATPTGPTSLCINSVNTDYTTTGATNATAYVW